jgi:alkanesulfonate monooxygenase SsuD/methylene tetrahydromethanopterin reductase-like flavin-dependent oxidoreductase (luciferase family)
MDFSAWAPARVDLAQTAREAERAGFDSLHLYDSQLLFGELFTCLALCADATKRLRVGAGVTNSLTRVSTVMANGLATLNQLAPGRTFLAIGTGYTSMKISGHSGAKLADVRRYIDEVRRLVRGEEATVEFEGRPGVARLIHRPDGFAGEFVNVSDGIPVYLAAAGPKGLALAGEIADGVILSIKNPADLDVAAVRSAIAVGAERAGRNPEDVGITVMLNLYVLEPGEDPLSRRVRESVAGVWQSQIGSWAAHRPPTPGGFERLSEDDIPADVRPAVDAYYRALDPGVGTLHPLESERWLFHAYEGHAWRAHPAVVDAITPEFLAKRAFVANAARTVELLRDWWDLGVTGVGLQLQHNLEHASRQISRVGSDVIPHLR